MEYKSYRIDQMSEKNSIGVILATFNGEKYIREQLYSLICQTRRPDLIIVSDGMSTDHTVDICESILSSQKLIRYKILKHNQQLSVMENFQAALAECNCNFIFFSDQDDVWQRDKVKITTDKMIRYNACLAFTNASIVNKNLKHSGKTLWDTIGFEGRQYVTVYPTGSTDLLKILFKHNVVTGMTMCIDFELIKYILPLTNHGMYDGWIALIAVNLGPVIAINYKSVLYRQHGNNQVGSKSSFSQKMKHCRSYHKAAQDREDMIREVIDRVHIISNKRNLEDMKLYLEFLKTRNQYLQNQRSTVSLLKIKKLYFDYFYKPREIILKDTFCRMFLIKTNY